MITKADNDIVLITSGEPGGIGPDICLDIIDFKIPPPKVKIVVIGDADLLEERAKMLNKNVNIKRIPDIKNIDNSEFVTNKKSIIVLHKDCPIKNTVGRLHPENVPYVLDTLDTAISLCKAGKSSKIVTCPINKEIINRSGIAFSGHTEYFANAFNCDRVVMMLANHKMKVALLTNHIPLSQVANYVTFDNLLSCLEVIINDFACKFAISNPKVGVCGLNPHAGEGGYLGKEEEIVINPVIKSLSSKGYNISGSYPADTIFLQASNFDIILAMYHDQGLSVIKYSDFRSSINVTLGLPITRTSVDHGTAISLAGTGIAHSESLFHAIKFALH